MPTERLAPVLAAKLHPPPTRPGVVARQRLYERLNAAANCRLTVISAPPGFGKTTLVRAWQAESGARLARLAWLALDEDDNDAARFITGFVRALQTLWAGAGHNALALLDSAQAPPPKAILATVLDDLGPTTEPAWLVLDDYHVITAPELHAALAHFINYAPAGLRLILTSRADPPLPLARWRARGLLAEIDAGDLRFTSQEAAAFFEQAMGLRLSLEDIQTLEARTEGWAAGLQLAGLSLQGQPAERMAAFIAAFSGSHRHVADYLVEEVLQRQPEGVREFLVNTSLLARLSGPLCEAVTGEAGGQARLEALERANLFLMPLDDERRWYRYHHVLREMLLARLKQAPAAHLAALHQRASAWYAQAGFITEAIQHALQAGDPQRAASLVEQNAESLFDRGDIQTLRAWVEQLPDAAVLAQPWLVLVRGSVLATTGQLEAAERLLNETSPLFDGPGLTPGVLGERAQLRASLARFQRDAPGSIAYARQALDLLPAGRVGARLGAHINLALASLAVGDTHAAQQALDEAMALGEAGNPLLALNALLGMGWYQARQGQLSQALKTYQSVTQRAGRLTTHVPPAFGMAYAGMGEVLYERNQLGDAQAALTRGVELLRASVEQLLLAEAWGLLAQAQHAQGNSAAARATLAQAENWLGQMQIADLGFGKRIGMQQALLLLRLGRVETAAERARASGLRPDAAGEQMHEAEYLVLARLWLAQGESAQALALLGQLQAAAEARQWTPSVIRCLALKALSLHAAEQAGQAGEALSALEQALLLAQPEGYVRTFLDEGPAMRTLLEAVGRGGGDRGARDYAASLVAAFAAGQGRPPAAAIDGFLGTPETLRARELEVLRLLAAGLSNKEIADRLILGASTVKTHINNLYRKLDVTSRTQAVARGRALGLLPD